MLIYANLYLCITIVFYIVVIYFYYNHFSLPFLYSCCFFVAFFRLVFVAFFFIWQINPNEILQTSHSSQHNTTDFAQFTTQHY